ncbi:MAG: efflux RND transporter permease subunit [Micavibrio sp.]|nr:efflux RND transporter permease subunit [Micavibrio sp.]
MMNFSAWAIRNPVPPIMLFVMLVFAGLIDFNRLSVQNFPDIDVPTVTVSVTYPGATAAQLETEVTRKIEDSVANIGNVDHVSSSVNTGSSVTTIEFVLEKDINEAVDDVNDAVDKVRTDLPTDAEDPIVQRVSAVGGAVVTYAVTSTKMQDDELSWFVDHDISKAVLGIKGVGEVTRIGGIDREIGVEIDPLRLQAYGVTMSSLSQAMLSMQQDVPSGNSKIGGREQSIRTLGTVDTVDKLRSLYIPVGAGASVPLQSIATVTDGAAEQTQAAYLDGKPMVGFEVYRSRGESQIDIAKGVAESVKTLMAANPDIKIQLVNTTVTKIESSYHASMNVLYEGAFLAVIVVLLFLRDMRATAISAMALPLSILPTFAVMYWLGFTLNMVTLLSLSLVVGILVDDAIVEIENIVRHLRMGKTAKEAALEAADEIGMAVIATTFTLISVFLPTAFMGGITGKIFMQFGWTAALSIFFSLLVARLLTPMMAAYMLKPTHVERPDGFFMRHYLATVHWCLDHRRLTMLGTALFLVGSIFIATTMTVSFMPAQEQGQVAISIELPPGSKIDDTIATGQQTQQALHDVSGVKSIYFSIGSSSIRKSSMLVDLTPAEDRKVTEAQILKEIRARLRNIPGARFSVGNGASGEKITIVLAGDNSEKLEAAAQEVTNGMQAMPELSNVISSASLLSPEVVITPDFARAADMGVTSTAIGSAVRVATSGDYDQNVAKFNLPEQQLYIRLKMPLEARSDLNVLRQLRVPSRDGTVTIGSVADLGIDSAPVEIDRYDRDRNVTISAELGGASLGDMLKKVNALPIMKSLPPGVHTVQSGDVERMQELFGNFGMAMATALLCVLGVLVLLFKDIFQPVTIVSALPLSAGGALGFLVLCGYGFSMPTLIGLLMLMGIVTKNSILLVEYAIVAREQRGLTRLEALIDSCHKRATPILMTTIAMIAGMIPIAMGLEGDSSFRGPMAIAVIGGLLTSTLLSLIVVPVVYTYIDDFENFIRRLVGAKTHDPDMPMEPHHAE